MDALANEWDSAALDDWGVNVWQEPKDGEGGGSGSGGSGMSSDNNKELSGSLLDRFIVPPFSILDTRQGYWQNRKKLWKERIGDFGETRNQTLFSSLEILYKDLYSRTMKHRKELGISFKEYIEKYVPDDVLENEKKKVTGRGVSILDPVMAELVCRWFAPEKCKSFDCFAGDSVFGYVSAFLGHEFTGIELRQEQCELNNERVEGMTASYINDDGQNVAKHIEANSQDLLFSCPPYFDLEHYSDLPNDASNQKEYEDFLQILRNAFTDAVACLKENRFAVIVVGDVRDKRTGFYYGFIDDVKAIFKAAGMRLLNELIIVENPASSPLRVGRYMEGRKVAKTHQNVLVFYKGNANDIKKHFKKIEYASEDLESFGVDTGDESAEAQV